MSRPAVTADRPAPGTRVSNQRNVLVNWGAFLMTALVGFFLSPFMVRTLGNDAYGVWALLGSITTYMGLLDLGIRSAVTRYTARLHAQARHAEAGAMASAALAAFSLLGLVTVATATVLSVFLDDLFTIPPALLPAARAVLLISGVNIGIALLNGVFGGVITARQRLDLIGTVDIGAEVLRAGAIVLVLSRGAGLIGLSLVHLGTTLFRVGTQLSLARRLYPEMRYALRGWDRGHLRDILSFSVYSTLIFLSSTVILQADAIVIGAFLPVSMITFFAIGATLTTYARSLNRPVIQTVPPRVSALDARHETDGVVRVTLATARISSLVTLPLAVTFLLRGRTFIGLWMGPEYAGPSGQVLTVLTLSLALSAPRGVLQGAFVGLNRHRHLVPWYVAEAVANLALSVALIHPMGIVGVAWGTTGPSLVTSLVVVPLLTRRWLRIGLRRLFTEMWIRPLAAVAPFAAALWAIEHWWPAAGLLHFFLQVAAALPVAAAGAWLVALDPDQRQAYAGTHVARARAMVRRLRRER